MSATHPLVGQNVPVALLTLEDRELLATGEVIYSPRTPQGYVVTARFDDRCDVIGYELARDPAAIAANPGEEHYGPVGALVYVAYWGLVHRVISHNADGSVTVETIRHPLNNPQWANDASMYRVKTHATWLDRRDRIIALPIRRPVLQGPRERWLEEFISACDIHAPGSDA